MLGKGSLITRLHARPATPADDPAIWAILEPTFRAGETYPIPRDISRAEALAYWRTPGHWVFVAERADKIVGTYYLRANQKGGVGKTLRLNRIHESTMPELLSAIHNRVRRPASNSRGEG